MDNDAIGEVNQTPIEFKIYTRAWDPDSNSFVPSALKSSIGPDGKMRLHGIASSTVKDLHGDNMLLSALEDMERAANQNLTIFGNHEYRVPEDVYGSVEKATLKQGGTVDAAGDPVYDLMFDVVVNDENPRALETFRAIEKGTKLGMSIGAMIPEGGATRAKKGGSYTIGHVDLLETSIVGIPANPRSWVENAVKAVRDARKAQTTVPLGSPELTLDTEAGTYAIRGSMADVGLAMSRDFDGIEIPDGGWATKHEACGYAAKGTFPDGVCPGCGEIDVFKAFPATELEEAVEDQDKNIEPEVTDAKVTIIEVDTGSSESDPVPAVADETADGDDDVLGDDVTMAAEAAIVMVKKAVTDDLDANVASTISQLLEMTQGLIRELGAAKTGEREAIAARESAEKQRNEVASQAVDVIAQTNQLVQKLADLRVGPRAVIREAAEEVSSLEDVYGSAFMEMLRSKK